MVIYAFVMKTDRLGKTLTKKFPQRERFLLLAITLFDLGFLELNHQVNDSLAKWRVG